MGVVTLWRSLLVLLLVTLSAAYYNNPPSLRDKVASRVIAKLGRTTKLRCPVDSNPDLMTWKKDGQTLNLGFGRYSVSKKAVLKISNTTMSDAGLYTCVAANGYGSISLNTTVIVLDEENKLFKENGITYKKNPEEDLNREGYLPIFPDFEKMEESRKMKKPTGSTLKLVCKVEGYPEPAVQWFKDGELYNNNRERRSHVTLKVHHVTETDSGRYMCVAKNRLGQSNFTYTVQVIGKIREKPRLIAPHPQNRTVSVGDSVSFQCDIESVVEPVVQWLKRVDGDEEFPGTTLIPNKGEKYRVMKNAGVLLERAEGTFLNKLVIKNVKPEDAGKFVCLAVNKGGSSSRHAYLFVKPRNAGDSFNPSLLEARSSGKPHSNPSSQDTSEDINLPLFIGLPACIVLIIIILVVIFMQRNNQCRSNNSAKAPTRSTPVPPQEREAYYYSNCQQQHLQQSVNPLLQHSREKSTKTPTPSIDMTGSEFSSVSRSHQAPHFYHHNNHNNHNNYASYGY